MVSIADLSHKATSLATNPKHTRWLGPLLLGLDAALCALIIWKVPYTEIDWLAYMQQVQLFLSGEKDYVKLVGNTGPLVYPGAHVYTYAALYKITNRGTNILLAQAIFGLVYLTTLATVIACYRKAEAPPYIFPILILSKRLHSIFVLRCFNDCFAVLFLWIAIYAYQQRLFTIGSLAYSWGLGTKMTLLLSLPALTIIVFLTRGVATSVRQIWLKFQVQLLISLPFLPASTMGYLSRSFEVTRQFLFKWTVNWRFVGEKIFVSKEFSNGLLAGHASVLLLFVLTRWLRPARRSVGEMIVTALHFEEPLGDIQPLVSQRVTPRNILTIVLTANVIGLLFARSLHYQFYAYLAWATPFLLWRSGLHPILQLGLWAAQEWAWNVYPSTDLSSQIVVVVLAVTVASVWWGTADEEFPAVKNEKPQQIIK